jgi:hypothetical protein
MIDGYVYLIVESDENGNEKYKIGVTKNDPEKRLKKLSTGNSNQLDVIRVYKSKNYRRIERFLHKKYSSQKTLSNNEFFHLTVEQVLSFINTCKEAENIIDSLKDNPFYI